MTPNYRNFPPIFPFELSSEDHDLSHPLVSPNYQASSSSSHSSCQIFFNSATQYQTGHHDHTEFFLPEYQPKVDNYASSGGSYDLEKKNKAESDINLTLWKRKDRDEKNMRLKQKLEDQKQQSSTRLETDHSSNSSSNNSNNFPIRVCADCNTTKTPLWRGGPKGPKSLCNACGIRQRKARKAMAAAAAAEGTTLTTEKSTVVKIKLKKKEKTTNLIATNHIKPYKKRWRLLDTTDGSSSSSDSQNKKLRFEDLFTNFSKKLAVNFPEDEKEAAILLMALSCGLVIHS